MAGELRTPISKSPAHDRATCDVAYGTRAAVKQSPQATEAAGKHARIASPRKTRQPGRLGARPYATAHHTEPHRTPPFPLCRLRASSYAEFIRTFLSACAISSHIIHTGAPFCNVCGAARAYICEMVCGGRETCACWAGLPVSVEN